MLRLFRSRPAVEPPASFFEVSHAGRAYRVAVKRVSRARRFTLKIRHTTMDAVLTMPPGGSLRAARNFAERHAEWIGNGLHRLPEKISLQAGAVIPLRGIEVRIEHRQALRGIAWVETLERAEGGSETMLCVTGTPDQQRRRMLDFLRREARRDLVAAVERHTAAIGRRATRITLRDTRSRWGSCTGRGSLNFSWRLVMAPPHVLDYLAAHEVAHLVHMDHSPAFWAVAERLAPGLASAEAWLKQHGAGLHRYG